MKTHAIITYSKIHYLLTAEQEEKLRDCRIDDEIEIDGSKVKVKNISDVLTLSKYYETYPDKRPQYIDKFKDLTGLGIQGTILSSRRQALEGIIKGIKRYIASDQYQGTEAPLDLLKLMEQRLNLTNNLNSVL